MTGNGGAESRTRSVRVLRGAIVRWCAVLAVPWMVAVAWFATHAGHALIDVVILAFAGWALVVGATGYGLRALLVRVEYVDEERSGLREAYDRARLDSLRDGLTGLGNHRAFQEELDEQVAIARSQGRPFSLLAIDLDDLKRTNDTNGHAAGDERLRVAARLITGNLRRTDHAFRVGGDEFAILLLDCAADNAAMIGRRILAAALDGGHGTAPAEPFSLTVGVSAYPELAHDRQQLVHQADAALYWGKRHGRTSVDVFDPGRHSVAEDGRPLEELAAAVTNLAANHLLTPVYQPIYCLRTGVVLGYEGLVRPMPGSGFANAGALFVAGEATGRTVELDMASIQCVLAGAAGLNDRQYLSINMSPRSLETESFNPFEVLALARRHGIEPARIVVELTEREAVEDIDRLRVALASLRRHGVRIAADDVGAGNAGLRLLSELTFDIIKADLSLVRAGSASQSSEAVLRALRDLAARRRQSIVAEGVETPEQLEVVMRLGFDAAQGYLLQRPAPHLAAPEADLQALVRRSAAAPPTGVAALA